LVRSFSSFVVALFVVACGGGGGLSGGSGDAIGTISSIEIRWAIAPGVAGYRIHWGRRSADYTDSVDVGMPFTDGGDVTYVLDDVEAPGTYYFAMTAYDDAGRSSVFSNEIAVAVE
jgi:hypothetical protein